MTGRHALVAGIGFAVVGAALAVPPGQAAASTTVRYSPTYTLADGPACGGVVRGTVSTHPMAPGRATVYVAADLYRLRGPGVCSVTVTVHWRGARGASGAKSATLVVDGTDRPRPCVQRMGRTFCGETAELRLMTGRGQLDSWITTSHPHLAGRAVINAF